MKVRKKKKGIITIHESILLWELACHFDSTNKKCDSSRFTYEMSIYYTIHEVVKRDPHVYLLC